MKSKDIVPLTEVYAHRSGSVSYHSTTPAVVLSTAVHNRPRYRFSDQRKTPAISLGKPGFSDLGGIPILSLPTRSIQSSAAVIAAADIQTVLSDGKITIGEDVLYVELVQLATIRSTWAEHLVKDELTKQNDERVRQAKQGRSDAIAASNARLHDLAEQLGLDTKRWSLPDYRNPFYGSPGLYAADVKIKPDVLTELLTELVEFRKTGRFEVKHPRVQQVPR